MTVAAIIAIIQADKVLKKLREKILSGKGTFKDTFAYNNRAAELLGANFSESVLAMSLDDRVSACVELLRDRYNDIMPLLDAVQKQADLKNKLHISPKHPPFNAERAEQIGTSLRDLSVSDERIQRRARSAPETATRAIHDDYIEANVELRSSAGIKCYITRTTDGNCCDWCTRVAGRYEYGTEPEDIFRRHDNCGCSVTYENGRERQDVWSKKTWTVPEDAGAPEPVRFTQEQAASAGAEPPRVFSMEEARNLNDVKAKENTAKPEDVYNSSIDISEGSGIIKSIKVDDFESIDPNSIISDECKETILNTLSKQNVSYVYDKVSLVNIPKDKDGKIEPLRTNAYSRAGYPHVVLEINEAFFAGRTKEQVDLLFSSQNYSVANNLEEAVVHEAAHAKVIQGITYARYEAINEELAGDEFSKPIIGREDKKSLKDLAGEISKYAQKDGLECIAESHVKLDRGEEIEKELKDLHDRYIQ